MDTYNIKRHNRDVEANITQMRNMFNVSNWAKKTYLNQSSAKNGRPTTPSFPLLIPEVAVDGDKEIPTSLTTNSFDVDAR